MTFIPTNCSIRKIGKAIGGFGRSNKNGKKKSNRVLMEPNDGGRLDAISETPAETCSLTTTNSGSDESDQQDFQQRLSSKSFPDNRAHPVDDAQASLGCTITSPKRRSSLDKKSNSWLFLSNTARGIGGDDCSSCSSGEASEAGVDDDFGFLAPLPAYQPREITKAHKGDRRTAFLRDDSWLAMSTDSPLPPIRQQVKVSKAA